MNRLRTTGSGFTFDTLFTHPIGPAPTLCATIPTLPLLRSKRRIKHQSTRPFRITTSRNRLSLAKGQPILYHQPSTQSAAITANEDTTIPTAPAQIAEEVLTLLKASFQPSHQFLKVGAKPFENYQGIDPQFYARHQARFEALGFEWVCDLEDKTISDQGKIVTFIRIMRHPRSNALATFYYIPLLETGFFEFQSLLSDGQLVVSTTVPESNKIADWPAIHSRHHPIDIDQEALYPIHLTDVLHSCKEDISILEINSFEAVVELQNKLNRYKHEYLQSIGWATKEYLLNQCLGDEQLADRVYAIIQQMINKDQ